MKKSFFLLKVAAFSLCIAAVPNQTKAQPPSQFARHFWINPLSVNYTLSPPTTNGEWMLAAARNEEGVKTKNTIAVFKLGHSPSDNNMYGIRADRVIGLPPTGTTGGLFNPDVEFEVHCIVQSAYPDSNYLICGSMRKDVDARQNGMVVVLDAGLHVLSIREYPDIETFYFVYAENNRYFVCGNTHNGNGIVMQDNVLSPTTSTNAYVTTIPWTFHKIKAKANHGAGPSGIISVSGSGPRVESGNQEIGCTVFNIQGGGFSNIATYKFSPLVNSINSNVVISNYPQTNDMGLILSVSNRNSIYTYLFDNYLMTYMQVLMSVPTTVNAAFMIHTNSTYEFKMEDMDCGESRLAWVGNTISPITQRKAHYIGMRFSQPLPVSPPFLPTPVKLINFEPNPPANTYYSLHKVNFFRDGDREFHAGGYYKHSDNDKTTFVVTPEDVGVLAKECVEERESEAKDFERPSVSLLPLTLSCPNAILYDWHTVRYLFCITDECQIEKCGNQLNPDQSKK